MPLVVHARFSAGTHDLSIQRSALTGFLLDNSSFLRRNHRASGLVRDTRSDPFPGSIPDAASPSARGLADKSADNAAADGAARPVPLERSHTDASYEYVC